MTRSNYRDGRGGDELVLVAYDIADDARRARIARVLEDYGERVQYSVFECRLARRRRAELVSVLRKCINAADDAVAIYRFCGHCGGRLVWLGRDRSSRAHSAQYLIW